MTNQTQTDRLAEVLDWVAVAKSAGENGIRYRTNASMVQFLTDIAATQSLSTDLANAEARVKELEGDRGLLLAVMDAADRYNGVHSQSAQPMARMQGTLMLAISRAYRELGISRDELARAAINPGKERA